MKLAILGLGSAGQRHYRNAVDLGHTVFGYDPIDHTPAMREAAIKETDAVVIASPSQCHLADALDCMAAGKPILIEKPIALVRQRKAIQDLIELNAVATFPLVVGVGYQLRFHPLIVALRQTLCSETTTNAKNGPYYASFMCAQYTESKDALLNGCLETWATHEIDLASHLLNADLRLVDHAVTRFEVDLRLIEWTKKHRCNVLIHSDMRSRTPIRRVMVCTERQVYQIDLEKFPVTNEHYRDELAAFIARVEGAPPTDPLASGQDGVLALRIAERAMI